MGKVFGVWSEAESRARGTQRSGKGRWLCEVLGTGKVIAVMKLPALTMGGDSYSQRLVSDGIWVSRPVQVLEAANCAETPINRGFQADLSRAIPYCPQVEMVRDAGFEPAGPLLNIRHLRKLPHRIAHPARKRALGLTLAR